MRSILVFGLEPKLSCVRKLTWMCKDESIKSRLLDWTSTAYAHMLFVVLRAEVEAIELAKRSS